MSSAPSVPPQPISAPPTAARGAPWDAVFHDLMPNRVREVLLVSSHYDAFILEEDGRLTDRIFTEYSELNLSNAPRITHVASGVRAMEMIAERRFDLVMTMVRISDTDANTFGKRVKAHYPGLPVVLLVRTEADLVQFGSAGLDRNAVDHVFCWTGDARILIAIIKLVEDGLNIAHDIQAGVRAIIVVEDSVRRYSAFLSILYTELMKQSESLVAEGLNDLHRMVRMRARPKVLLATSYEDAMAHFDRYQEAIIAVISDVRFPRHGQEDAQAGFDLVQEMRGKLPDLAVLMQSAEQSNAARAQQAGLRYADKNSPQLLKEIRDFVKESLGFGEFVFRLPDRTEVGRARHAYELEQLLKTVPAESIAYHANRDHFSHWLTARCLFDIANKIRPKKAADFGGPEAIRKFLVEALAEERTRLQEGSISDWTAKPDASTAAQFIRLGKGSIGGKARGLAFVGSLIARHGLADRFPGLSIRVPYSVVVPTDEFDKFMEAHKIQTSGGASQKEIHTRFMTARLSDDLRHKLRRTVAPLQGPLAVRSSSLLEDSQLQPFAGIYSTIMLPNNHFDPEERFGQLCRALKAVWASTYSEDARSYIGRTQYSVEEEKMAVLIQEIVGQPYGNNERFYPHIGGVAVSYNYYPIGHQKAEDGLAYVALGLGQQIVQGGAGLQFSPGEPSVLPQFGSAQDYLRYTQKRFYALDLTQSTPDYAAAGSTREYELATSEADGTLGLVGSVYASDDDVIRDDLGTRGPRVVSFHNILRWDALPLAAALKEMLALFREGLGCPVEIEFAVDAGDYGRTVPHGRPRREPCLYVLQVRPQATQALEGIVETEGFDESRVFCKTDRSLGHGIIEGIRDVIYVKRSDLKATETPGVAEQVGALNAKLMAEKTPYLLVGPGRWGSSDPRLGVPVKWAQIAGARVIVETTFQDREVEPSQAAHFFHNVTSFRIGYLTISNVDRRDAEHRRSLDAAWIESQPVIADLGEVRHVRLEKPLRVLLDGRASTATILKPE